MNSTDYRVTALLTEHLGFAPLTLIDQVINDVNGIMYKCTDALERFLTKRRDAQVSANSDNVFSGDEIKLGAAELETLLESHVDKNFDKFELYTLRNILTIPGDLVDNGWIRLKHHDGLTAKSVNMSASAESDDRISSLVASINLELQLRKMLLLQKEKAAKIVGLLRHYKQCVETITLAGANSKLLAETAATLRLHLQPLNENVYYLLGQVDDLLKRVLQLNDKFMKDESLDGIRNIKFGPTVRDNYIREKSLRILDEIGVLQSDTPLGQPAKVLYSAFAQEDST